MGIAPYVARAIVREHAYKPIRGTVLCLGRQTMFFTPADALDMLAECGLVAAEADLVADSQTFQRRPEYISDKSFFDLLGAPEFRALDHSDYEGADLVWDLNKPIPTDLHGIADFILDGSTLDNVFNPAQALINIGAMLRPAGRVLSVNMGSLRGLAYTALSPQWFLDYFTVNGFADTRIYITVHAKGVLNVFTPDLATVRPGGRLLENFDMPLPIGTVAFAEKAANSTSDALPSQQCYRGDDQWARYMRNMTVMSARPDLVRSTAPVAVRVPKQYLYISPDGKRQERPFSAHAIVPNRIKRWIVNQLTDGPIQAATPAAPD